VLPDAAQKTLHHAADLSEAHDEDGTVVLALQQIVDDGLKVGVADKLSRQACPKWSATRSVPRCARPAHLAGCWRHSFNGLFNDE
jgi:hypothetical protein